MPQTPDWAKYINAGAEFVALTRAQARARAKELVAQGQLAQSQVQGFVDDLVDESRRRTDSMMDLVRTEIGRQVKTLGIATKDDLAKLEAKLVSKGAVAGKQPTAAKSATKKPAKKPAKKAGAKKATKKTAKQSSSTRAASAS
jgi:polyhydroxyalkanoate synthesis regulator phasin